MRFVGAAGEDVEAQDFGDDAGGFAGAVDAMIGELVGRRRCACRARKLDSSRKSGRPVMVMQRASRTSMGASSQTTGTLAARRNSGAPC